MRASELRPVAETATDRYPHAGGSQGIQAMGERCTNCGAEAEVGFLSTSNGSGLFWSHSKAKSRLRPHDMEVVVPTEFGGTFSANLPGTRCPSCGTIALKTK
jgi:hypothetical protein